MAMVSASAGPAVTGLYPIVEVAGRRPTLLTDFVGAAEVIVLVDDQPMRLFGMGGLTANGMEFEQRDPAELDEAGVRVWTIIEDRDEKVLGRAVQSRADLTISPDRGCPETLLEARDGGLC